MQSSRTLSSLIWTAADDILRGLFKPSEYGRVILPFVVMRRLDCVLEPKKDQVHSLYTKYKDKLAEPGPVIFRKIGLPFYNVSRFDLSRLKSDPTNVKRNFNNYIQGYSKNVLDIFDNFDIAPLVRKLDRNNRLYLLIDTFTEFDLHPRAIDNHQMGSVYEELLRRFSEMSNEESGDHFTPRDVVRLLVSFVFAGDRENLQGEGKIRSVYDPCCGTGGMLTIGKEWIHENINAELKIDLYGQELNDVTYAICKSDFLMLDENPENIRGALSSLSEDQFQGYRFDYMITNPPFGVSWKSEKDFVVKEAADPSGRFSVGLPKVTDGSFLFIQHLMHKLPDTGGRIGIVLNASPLYSGDAKTGESNIRKWLFENDYVETIVALPNQMFFNTPIFTYFWILSNRKRTSRAGKVQLIDGRDLFTPMKTSLGDKRKFITADQTKFLLDAYLEESSTDRSKFFPNSHFGYSRVRVEAPFIENGEPVYLRSGQLKIDPSTRDYERVPLDQDVNEFIKKNVLPFKPFARIDESKTLIGYAVNFEREFFQFKEPTAPSTYWEECLELQNSVSDLFGRLE